MSIQRSVLERLRKGDEQAFEVVYHAFHRRIYGFLLSSLGEDESAAEDLLQSFFLRLWEARSNIDVDKDFTAYLFTIARNLVYKELREKMTYTVVKLLEEKHDVRDHLEADQLLEAESLQSYIVNLLDELPSARNNIFILSRFKHMSNKEIASLLSIS